MVDYRGWLRGTRAPRVPLDPPGLACRRPACSRKVPPRRPSAAGAPRGYCSDACRIKAREERNRALTALKHLVIVLDSYDWDPADHYPVRIDPADAARLRKRAGDLAPVLEKYGKALPKAQPVPGTRVLPATLAAAAEVLAEVERRLAPRPDL